MAECDTMVFYVDWTDATDVGTSVRIVKYIIITYEHTVHTTPVSVSSFGHHTHPRAKTKTKTVNLHS